jgi:hypothetical protein
MSQVDFRIARSSVEGLDDDAVYWAVVEPIWPDLWCEDEFAQIAQGTPGQQAIFSTMLFSREVDNGGLLQFFGNSSGMYRRHVAAGLWLFGAQEHLFALSTALSLFPNGEPSLAEADRQTVLGNLSEQQKKSIKSAEDRVYRSGGFEEQLGPYWKRYIESHPAEFFL